MKQAYRWDVTGALNIVKFRSRFASNKEQLQRMSTTFRVNASPPSLALNPNRLHYIGNWDWEESYSQQAVGKIKT